MPIETVDDDELLEILNAPQIRVADPILEDEDWGEHCEFCGWCAKPGTCPWSVECPKCQSKPGENCRRPQDARIEPLHEERWQAVKELYGVYYRSENGS